MRKAFDALLAAAVAQGASDVHLSAGWPPAYRIDGSLRAEGEALAPGWLGECAAALLSERQQAVLERDRQLDMGYSLTDGTRFRLNWFFERGRLALAARWLPNRLPTMEVLRLPSQLRDLTELRDGLVLVTGPTGSGKSTTLASLIDAINRNRACHILTVEDPVEYLHANRRAVIHQRELHRDVPDFAQAVRAALREDPDVILVGEMRDLETMRAALMAAETGHLVFSTLHTGDAVGVIDRLVGMFPGAEQDMVRMQLAASLRAVVTQHLLPQRSGRGRVPAVEILRVTPAVSHLIRQHKRQQIYAAMEAGQAFGMQTLEAALARLVQERWVEEETALRLARHPDALLKHLGRLRRRG